MATYISLLSYSQQGIQNIKESPSRLDSTKKAFEAMGAKVVAFYLVMGQYDIIMVIEAPDDETVAKLALSISSLGSIRTQTLRAFTEDEYRKVIASLP